MAVTCSSGFRGSCDNVAIADDMSISVCFYWKKSDYHQRGGSMNYPVWYLPGVGGGFLIALIAVVHVFVSHFAVGGGLYLIYAEKKGLAENSAKASWPLQKGMPDFSCYSPWSSAP
jgi:hypothetical protein